MRSRRRVSSALRVAVLCAAQLLCASASRGQDRLSLELLELVSAGAAFGTTVGPAGALAGQLAAGGRYGLLPDRLIDRVTGAEIEFWNVLFLRTIATDPARARAFFVRHPNRFAPANAVVMADLRSGALTPLLTLPGLTGGLVTAQFAVDAERLVVSYPDASGVPVAWAVVDLAGGTPTVRSVAIPSVTPLSVSPWAVSPDGTRLYRAAVDQLTNTSALVAHDLATGLEVGRQPMPFSLSARVEWSDALDAVVDTRDGAVGFVKFTAFSRELQLIAGASVPRMSHCSAQAVVSAATGRVYVHSGGGNYFGMALPSRLTASSLGGPGPVDSADVPAPNCGGLRVASPPGAPRRVRASVSGGTVALAWENVGGASRFTIDVGVASGRTDLSIPLGPDSHASFAGVPAGTYYLRLRGGNDFGGGRASDEIRVVVP